MNYENFHKATNLNELEFEYVMINVNDGLKFFGVGGMMYVHRELKPLTHKFNPIDHVMKDRYEWIRIDYDWWCYPC